MYIYTAKAAARGTSMFEIDEATLAQLKVGKQAATLHMSEHPVSNGMLSLRKEQYVSYEKGLYPMKRDLYSMKRARKM